MTKPVRLFWSEPKERAQEIMEIKPGLSALVTGGGSGIGDLSAAFEKHVAIYGNLDICINCAGIGNALPFYEDQTDGTRSWRRTINVNLIAIIDCTRLACIIVRSLSHNFRRATSVVRKSLRIPIEPHKVLLKIVYAGVNAGDVNFSSGRYFGGNKEDIRSRLPFDAGFEVVGLVVAVGSSGEIGSPAAVMAFGGYAEYLTV